MLSIQYTKWLWFWFACLLHINHRYIVEFDATYCQWYLISMGISMISTTDTFAFEKNLDHDFASWFNSRSRWISTSGEDVKILWISLSALNVMSMPYIHCYSLNLFNTLSLARNIYQTNILSPCKQHSPVPLGLEIMSNSEGLILLKIGKCKTNSWARFLLIPCTGDVVINLNTNNHRQLWRFLQFKDFTQFSIQSFIKKDLLV